MACYIFAQLVFNCQKLFGLKCCNTLAQNGSWIFTHTGEWLLRNSACSEEKIERVFAVLCRAVLYLLYWRIQRKVWQNTNWKLKSQAFIVSVQFLNGFFLQMMAWFLTASEQVEILHIAKWRISNERELKFMRKCLFRDVVSIWSSVAGWQFDEHVNQSLLNNLS